MLEPTYQAREHVIFWPVCASYVDPVFEIGWRADRVQEASAVLLSCGDDQLVLCPGVAVPAQKERTALYDLLDRQSLGPGVGVNVSDSSLIAAASRCFRSSSFLVLICLSSFSSFSRCIRDFMLPLPTGCVDTAIKWQRKGAGSIDSWSELNRLVRCPTENRR